MIVGLRKSELADKERGLKGELRQLQAAGRSHSLSGWLRWILFFLCTIRENALMAAKKTSSSFPITDVLG